VGQTSDDSAVPWGYEGQAFVEVQDVLRIRHERLSIMKDTTVPAALGLTPFNVVRRGGYVLGLCQDFEDNAASALCALLDKDRERAEPKLRQCVALLTRLLDCTQDYDVGVHGGGVSFFFRDGLCLLDLALQCGSVYAVEQLIERTGPMIHTLFVGIGELTCAQEVSHKYSERAA
jgi:hypothetical protein